MKKIFACSFLVASIAVLFVSCKKEQVYLAQPTDVPAGSSFLKVNFNSSYAANPGVQIEVNKTRMSSLITSRTPFPGGGYNTGGGNYPDYLPVQPGNVELTVAIPKKNTNADSVVILTRNINLDGNKHYTLHITDTGANAKSVLVEDDLTQPDMNTARYRFINLMPNVPAIDLYYGSTIVAANIAYLGVSPSFTIPFPSTANPIQPWNTRPAGADPSSPVLATYNSSNTVLNQRVYTAFAVGYKGSTDATRKPYISFLLNR